MHDLIQSLWIGPRLSAMERLSIASFLSHGHPYHLYTYGEVEGVPPGVLVLDAGEILPAGRIFQYRRHPSYAGFANHFRYKLLFERGGWWADADLVCLQPFAFAEPCVCATEPCDGGEIPTNAVLKAPAGSELMTLALGACESRDPADLSWGETGPRLMRELIARLSLKPCLKPYRVFCPLGFLEWERVLDPEAVWDFGKTTHAIHLWHEKWRRSGRDKDGCYPPGCLYERLKQSYLSHTVGRA